MASGEPIPLKQEELSINGWAMEARLYAEDPAKGFLPSTGRLEVLRLPRGARIETGVEEGSEVSPFYDPMIAKIVVHERDRAEALAAMDAACRAVAAYPVKHNAWFLSRLTRLAEYQNATMTTGTIAANQDSLLSDPQPSAALLAAAASDTFFHSVPFDDTDRARGLMGFRPNGERKLEAALSVAGERITAPLNLAAAEQFYDGEATWWATQHNAYFEEGAAFVVRPYRAEGGSGHHAHDGDIIAPMPGKVIAVDVADGDAVTAGQRLMVLEAMKMEHALTAPFDGIVTGLSVSAGSQVQVEAVLAVVEPPND